MEDSVREGESHKSSNQEKVMVEVEAVIVSEVEKLQSLLDDKANFNRCMKSYVKTIIVEVKKIVEKLRGMKLEEKSKFKYLISDVVEDVGKIHGQLEVTETFILHLMWRDLKEINDGFHRLLQNNGVGDGDSYVVGLEEEVELLLHNMESVTSIEGYDGFGKTTLARQLYNHTDVVKKFKLRAWINCLDIVGRKELLINLIQQVASSQPKDVEKMDLQALQNMLRQQLMGNPYFIVLDNFWRYECFQSVHLSLPPNHKQSKLLLTCTKDMYINPSEYTHKIRGLDEGNSWKLLLKTMFPAAANNFPKKLERKGKQMLMKHTSGVPLAIKDVGMEWAEMRRQGRDWEDVIESQDLELRASLGALESSFYPYLEPDEKSCFLHIGLFKQTIKAKKFEQTWMVSRGETLSHTQSYEANDVFGKVGICKNANPGPAKSYEVGAIFHKLSIKKAKEENYGASHRVIYCTRERIDCPTDQDERLISLFFYGGGCYDDIPSYLKCFEKLRVLDFEGFGLKSIPETVGELIELRYLGLRNNYIQQLPSSLGCMKNLEVLDIALNFMVEVPDIIWEMEALVHLYMSDIFCRTPLKIEALKNLQTLTYISVDNWTYEVSGLQMMTSLFELGIQELNENSNVSKLFASLAAMENLECLVLRGSRFRSMPSLDKLDALIYLRKLRLDGRITLLPKAENFPPNLHRLSLVNSCFDEDPMPVLEKLSNLQYLKLQNAYTGRQMVFSKYGFLLFGCLCISELWNLRNIQVGKDALVYRFIRLEITSCPCLRSLPVEFTANIYKFEMVTTKNIAAKIKKLNLFSKKPHAVVDIQP